MISKKQKSFDTVKTFRKKLVDRTGADAVRLFLINSAALKADELRFSEDGVKQIAKSVMLPLWNAFGFFISNHNADSSKGQLGWQPSDVWKQPYTIPFTKKYYFRLKHRRKLYEKNQDNNAGNNIGLPSRVQH